MFKSALHETTVKYNTDFWNDSCSLDELKYAMDYGAVGATTNPVIVKNVIESEFDTYQEVIRDYIKKYPDKTEDEIAWKIIEKTAIDGAELLKPIYDKSNGQKGRISIQVNTKYFNNPKLMADQAVHFHNLAPNMQVKMPITAAGVKAIEEATYKGVSINATVSFSLPQVIAVADAVERGLKRREKENLDISTMHPVCTIMVGRIDDWLKDVVKRDDLEIDQKALEWAGIAVMKKAYNIFEERGYRTGLLAAAYRNDNQWLEFVGGDLELTIPHKWIKKFNEGDYTVEKRIDKEVDKKYIDELYKIPDFTKMYEEDAMKEEEFVQFGATQKTLRQFFEGYDQLLLIIRREQLELA